MPRIQAIYRYPIKGLSPEPLPRVALTPGETIPGDRLYAIENGPSGFDPIARPYLAKQHFLILMRNERLARLRTGVDQETHTLTISCPSPQGGEGARMSEPLRADLRTAAGRAGIEAFFAEYCADELRGPPKILHAEGHSFSDVARKVVSIINLASVAAVAAMVGAAVDPLRFRGNLYVDGLPAWSELDLVGRQLTINPPPLASSPPPHAGEGQGGGQSFSSPPPHAGEGQGGGTPIRPKPVRLKIVKRTVRCAATNVDPATGTRDLNIPQALMRTLGHADCGVYAEVVDGGEIAAGDIIAIA